MSYLSLHSTHVVALMLLLLSHSQTTMAARLDKCREEIAALKLRVRAFDEVLFLFWTQPILMQQFLSL